MRSILAAKCIPIRHHSKLSPHRLSIELLEDRTLLSFLSAPIYPAGRYPDSVAVGDFNGDGHLDLAVANDTKTGTVSILLNKGDGTFQAAKEYTVGSYADSVAVADFNGDGKLDLAVANAGSYRDPGTVTILLGNGDGTFQDARSVTVGSHPSCVAVGDLNGDGIPDLAVANYFSSTVSVLLGKGDGTFQPAQAYAVGYPTSLAVGDLNGDGVPDLAVASGYSVVSVLLGKGNGTFQATRDYAAGSGPAAVAVADFNGDGIPDLAVANNTTLSMDSVTVLLGKGDGTFLAAHSYATGSGALSVAVGDFDGDGHPDLAVGDSSGVSVLLGGGYGAFGAATIYGVGSSYSVAVGDFDGNGKLDLAVANHSLDTVSVLPGRGDGTFLAQTSYAAGFSPTSVALGDFDGDGKLDVAVANSGDSDAGILSPSTVSVFLDNGNGTFQAAQNYTTGGFPSSVVVADFNGDGHLDLAVADFLDGNVAVLLGEGNGTFQAARYYAVGVSPCSLAVGDFNADGYIDLAVANFNADTVTILLGNGDGTFQPGQSYTVGRHPCSVVVADFNRDGTPDLAVANQGTTLDHQGTVSILLGAGDGTFQAAQSYTVTSGSGCRSIAVGDFAGDGHLDLALASYGSNTLNILMGNGDGTFGAAQSYATGLYPASVAVADFNGDGKLDLVVANSSGVIVFLGNGDGTFQASQSCAAGGNPTSVAVGSFTGSGYADLAVADYSSNSVTVLVNAADWAGPPSPGRPAAHWPLPHNPSLKSVAALLSASKIPTESVVFLTSADVAPGLMWRWTLEAGQTTHRAGMTSMRPMSWVRHSQETAFDQWEARFLTCSASTL
jgi:hypothetical protein